MPYFLFFLFVLALIVWWAVISGLQSDGTFSRELTVRQAVAGVTGMLLISGGYLWTTWLVYYR